MYALGKRGATTLGKSVMPLGRPFMPLGRPATGPLRGSLIARTMRQVPRMRSFGRRMMSTIPKKQYLIIHTFTKILKRTGLTIQEKGETLLNIFSLNLLRGLHFKESNFTKKCTTNADGSKMEIPTDLNGRSYEGDHRIEPGTEVVPILAEIKSYCDSLISGPFLAALTLTLNDCKNFDLLPKRINMIKTNALSGNQQTYIDAAGVPKREQLNLERVESISKSMHKPEYTIIQGRDAFMKEMSEIFINNYKKANNNTIDDNVKNQIIKFVKILDDQRIKRQSNQQNQFNRTLINEFCNTALVSKGGAPIDELLKNAGKQMLDTPTRVYLRTLIFQAIDIYFSDTNFTYKSFFNGTYSDKNPEPTKEQKAEDAEFTNFLLRLCDELADFTSINLLIDLQKLSEYIQTNTLNINSNDELNDYNSNSPISLNNLNTQARAKIIRNNGRNYIQRELSLGHLLGGKRFKKTRKAIKPRKRYSRRR
jgi:hypothetical protein